MTDILTRVRKNSPPKEFSEIKLTKVLELYVNWYDGDIAAAKTALIQDIIEHGESEEVAKWHAGIVDAIIEAN